MYFTNVFSYSGVYIEIHMYIVFLSKHILPIHGIWHIIHVNTHGKHVPIVQVIYSYIFVRLHPPTKLHVKVLLYDLSLFHFGGPGYPNGKKCHHFLKHVYSKSVTKYLNQNSCTEPQYSKEESHRNSFGKTENFIECNAVHLSLGYLGTPW